VLKKTEDKVRGINSLIERKRADARRDLNRIRNLIRAASDTLGHADWLFRKARDSFNWFRNKRRSIERRGWFPFKGAVVWGAKKAEWAAEKVLDGARKVRDAAQRALNNIANAEVPLDMHPLVAPLVVAREVAITALRGAQITLAGAEGLNNTFKDVTNKLIKAVSGAKILVVKKAVFTGSIREARTDVHINADIMNSPNHFMRLKVNLSKPLETDLRDLALTITSIIKGEKVEAAAGALPEPPNLPVATVSKKEIQAAILAAAQAQIERRKAAERKEQERKQQLAAQAKGGSALVNVVIIGHQGRCIDFSEGTKNKRGARKAQVWDCHGGKNQRFTMTGNGELRADGLCLDPQEDGWLWGYKCTDHPGMRFRKLANGRIQHISSGRCVDLWGVESGNGKALRLGGCHDGANQKWKVASDVPKPGAPDRNFRNMYIAANDNAACLDSYPQGGALGAIPCQAHGNLRFTFWSDDTIRHDPQDRCLNVQNGGANGAPVVVAKCDGHSDQKWDVAWSGGKGPSKVDATWRFRIVHKATGRCLGVRSGRTYTVNCGGSSDANTWPSAQTWRASKSPLKPMSLEANSFNLAQLVNGSGLCADEQSGKLTKGGKVISWSCNSSGAARKRQLWAHNDRGQIIATNGLCLDVNSGKTRPPRMEQIIIWGCNGEGDAMQRQRWRRLPDGRIQHITGGQCIDVTNNGGRNGRLVLNTCSDDKTQKWSIRGPSS